MDSTYKTKIYFKESLMYFITIQIFFEDKEFFKRYRKFTVKKLIIM